MSRNILIAEDEPQNRKIQLTRRNYNVAEATSSHEAHATLIEKKTFTVILGDLNLPDGMNAQHIDQSRKRTDQPKKTYVTRASRRALFGGVLASLLARHVLAYPTPICLPRR